MSTRRKNGVPLLSKKLRVGYAGKSGETTLFVKIELLYWTERGTQSSFRA